MTSEPLNQDTEIIKKSFYITFNYLIKNFGLHYLWRSLKLKIGATCCFQLVTPILVAEAGLEHATSRL